MYTLRETPPPVYPATIIQVSLQYSLQEYCQQVISRTRRAGHTTTLHISLRLVGTANQNQQMQHYYYY